MEPDPSHPSAPQPAQYEELPEYYVPQHLRRDEPASAPHDTSTGRQPHERDDRTLLQRIGGAFVAFGLLFLKFGKVLFLGLKGAKFFGLATTMVISVAGYSVLYGWKFAVGLVALIFVHECGHVIQVVREGRKFDRMLFVPFFGAFVSHEARFDEPVEDARIALAGPLVGGLGALAAHGASIALDSPFLQAVAFFGYFLNLVNLAPVAFLDGARMKPITSPVRWALATGACVATFLVIPNPGVLVVGICAAFTTFGAWGRRHDPSEPWHDPSIARRSIVPYVLFVVMVVGYSVLMTVTHVEQGV